MIAPSDAHDPTVLFDEYVQGVLDGKPPDLEELYRRAGDRRDDLRAMIGVAQLLHEIHEGAGDDVLPDRPLRDDTTLHSLGRFLDLQPLGEGGLSRVYRARDPQLHREVALKVLSVPPGMRREWVENEGRSLARLKHPGVVRVNSLEEAGGRPFLVMDLVPGPSLREVLSGLRARAGRSAASEATPGEPARAAAERLAGVAARCELVARIADALDYCHQNGVIHRDIKPHNVLLGDGDQPVLIDFGLAHLDSAVEAGTNITQRLVGTPAYISPEQVDSNQTGASELSDQFSLGVLLYELITLSHPFRLATRTGTLTAISRADPLAPRRVDPELPADLERIALHALERVPAARYPSCAALAADLRAFLEHRAISLQPPTAVQATRLWLRRNRRSVGLGSAAVAALVVAWAAASVLNLRLDRTAFSADVATLRERLPALQRPDEMQAAYLELQDLRNRATPLQARLFAPFFQPLGPQVAEVSEACSHRLADLTQDDLRVGKDRLELRAALLRWSPALTMDALTCPDSDVNRANRERGLADLPALHLADGDEVRVDSLQPDIDRPANLVLRRVLDATGPDARPLGSGHHRIVVRRADGRCEEADHVVAAEELRQRLDTRPLPDPTGAAFVVCPGGRVDFPEVSSATGKVTRPALSVDVPACVLGRRPVSWAEFEAALPGVRRRPASAAPDDPAVVRWAEAAACARALGARLPSVLELHLAWLQPGVERPQGSKLRAEWSCNLSPLSSDNRVIATYAGNELADDMRWAQEQPEVGLVDFVAFRLAFTAQPWPDE
jgi:tRNA A-37 threonylcarbamoyl transferase component Bud32